MTVRVAAGFLAILAAGLIAAPVESSAGSGAFAGSRAMQFQRGVQAPTSRPAVGRPRPVAAPGRVHAGHFKRFRHRRAPVVVVVGVPWYGGYDDSTYLAPDEQGPSVSPPTEADTMRPPPGCRAQAYKVRSEDGGERSVEVVRCW